MLLDGRHSGLQMEKDELERQLSSTKQELFSEQKKHRQEMDSLEEKFESQKIELAEAVAEKEASSLEISAIKSKVDKLERQLEDAEKSNLHALIVSREMNFHPKYGSIRGMLCNTECKMMTINKYMVVANRPGDLLCNHTLSASSSGTNFMTSNRIKFVCLLLFYRLGTQVLCLLGER